MLNVGFDFGSCLCDVLNVGFGIGSGFCDMLNVGFGFGSGSGDMLNVAFGFDKRSCNISNVGFDFDSDMSQVLVLISVSALRGPGSICWFRTPTNEFRLSLVQILILRW